MKKIALVGILPPPIGGRSIYFKKTINKLLNDYPDLKIDAYILNKNIDDIFLNHKNNNLKIISNYRSLIINILLKKYKIVHTNDENFKVLSIISLFCYFTNTQVFLNMHSFRSNPKNYSLINKICMRISFNFLNRIFVVGKNEFQKLNQYVEADKLEQISPHIRISRNHNEFLKTKYDIENLEVFLKKNYKESNLKKNDFVLTWNGSILENEINDAYGLNLFFDMINKIESEHRFAKRFKYILVVIGLSKKEESKLSTIENRIKNNNLEKKVILLTQTISFNEVLSYTSLYIRPTRTDSYGLSVSEALDFGIPTIASNVCERPNQVNLFNNGDLNDLYKKVEYVFSNYENQKFILKEREEVEGNNNIEKIYNEIF